ncbi:hypothetical protein [Candidatus Oscillochloris fontis]|uniref:hypothetical protein n=1 Tax=Candidatus Oscillochloris fontis TaxID=2496868 RepID=UPI00101DA274|nr:hypothetical protein [Candidatus Oscillochloris fontis]
MQHLYLPLRHWLVAAILVLVLFAGALAASAGGDFTLVRWSSDGGGGASTGGQYTLVGTIGQPDASTFASSGGDFQVVGGFWAGKSGVYRNFLPLVAR